MWKEMGCERDVIVIDELKGRGKRGRMSEVACREGFHDWVRCMSMLTDCLCSSFFSHLIYLLIEVSRRRSRTIFIYEFPEILRPLT